MVRLWPIRVYLHTDILKHITQYTGNVRETCSWLGYYFDKVANFAVVNLVLFISQQDWTHEVTISCRTAIGMSTPSFC